MANEYEVPITFDFFLESIETPPDSECRKPGWILGSNIDQRHTQASQSFAVCIPNDSDGIIVYIGLSPFPVIVTTRIVSCLVGNPYKPSFATTTGKGDNPMYIYILYVNICSIYLMAN